LRALACLDHLLLPCWILFNLCHLVRSVFWRFWRRVSCECWRMGNCCRCLCMLTSPVFTLDYVFICFWYF